MSNASLDGEENVAAWDKHWSDTDLVQICRQRAICQPNNIGYTYLVDGESEEANLTYGELDLRARLLASELQRVAEPGDRALLVFEPGLDYIVAFYGCLYADVVAVPVYPPNMLRLDRSLPRLTSIITDAQARVVLCTSQGCKWASLFTREANQPVSVIPIDELEEDDIGNWTEPVSDPHRLAYLQYTSGSTGQPKGVMVSHRNMAYNVAQMDRRRAGEEVIGVTWLPAYHDFGLVGAILLPMYTGCRTVSMSPLAFVQRPLRWLDAISRYRGTITGAPNFSFDLCVDRTTPEERRKLDLSCLSIILNGAEPIRSETMYRFLDAFGPSGLSSDAFVPSYGLAEATLGVASAPTWTPFVVRDFDAVALEQDRVQESEQAQAQALVSSGFAFPNTKLAIACPVTGQLLPEDKVGEIWVQGPGVAEGYWDQPEASAATFGATFSGIDDPAGKWMRTGDLGFMADEQLYITGRLKDIIIVNGRNLYPQDIEETVQSAHPAISGNSGAAFSIFRDGQERLVVVQEVRRPRKTNVQEVAAAIQETVLSTHELPLSHLVLVNAGTIPKTTSGKIQRSETRNAWLENRLSVVAQWQSRAGTLAKQESSATSTPLSTDTEHRVASLFCEVLGCLPPGANEHFFELGGQSLLATQLVVRVREEFLIDMPLKALFLAPTVAELATEIDRLVQLSSEKTALRHSAVTIPIVAECDARLSAGQERIWFVQQLTPESPIFNLCLSVRMRRELDSAALEQAWQDLVDKHESLRTVFPITGKQLRPMVKAQSRQAVRREDLSELDAATREEKLCHIGQQEAASTFSLATGPLWRVSLVRCGENDHTLFLSMHHIISDGWSMSVLLRELLINYERLIEGQPTISNRDRVRPAIRYTDFAAWSQTENANEIAEEQIGYWREQLASVPSHINLPLDRPRPSSPTLEGATLDFVLPREICRGVERIGRTEGVTPFMVTMAALQAVLARYSGQQDICVGTAVAGRNRPEFESLVGFFVNTLVIRGDLTGNPTFREFLAQVRDTSLTAYDHADVTFERLVEELAPQRDMRHAPLFQVSLVYQNQPWQEPIPDVQVREVHNGTSKYDLTWTLWEQNNQLHGTLEYSTELFDTETAQQLIASFQTLLSDAIENADTPVSELSIQTKDQTEAWLQNASGELLPFPNDTCIHRLFEERVAAAPNALAVDSNDASITYDELNRQANRLARRLVELGVGPDKLVGISTPRNVGMIKAMLAVLKAGGGCLPLDPDYPVARIQQTIQDSGPCVLLTEDPTRLQDYFATEKLSAGKSQTRLSGPLALAINFDDSEIDDANLPDTAAADDLAYVIYTSGSTGVPKGVMVEHRNVGHMITWYSQCLGVRTDSRVLQFASLSFDAAMGEIFTTLCTGATLVLPPPGKALPGQPFVDFLQHQRVSSALIPPSFLEMLPDTKLPELKDLTVSGEVCPKEVVRRFGQGRRMFNGYGPTEGTVGATWYECNVKDNSPPLIGRPFPNVRVYLLDSNLQPVPTGVTGEIYIAGSGVARGYLNRPELNAQRFLPDPFQSGDRMYRTGDLACWHRDGNLQYRGRCDEQIKVRGFRIEPGEIEAALEGLSGVRRAAVVASQQNGGRRLVAYLTADRSESDKTDGQLQPRELRNALAKLLPNHMLPAEYVYIESLPLSPTGKVDRLKLAARSEHDFVRNKNGEEAEHKPRNENERKLQKVWLDVLELDAVGIHDNYFEVGGNSLHIMQITAGAAAEGLRLSPRQLFEHQTIAQQAVAATEMDSHNEFAKESGEIPLSPIQHWFLESNPENPDHFNQAVMLDLHETPNVDVLSQAINKSFARHDALSLRCEYVEGQWRQYYHEDGGCFEMDVVSLAEFTTQKIEELAATQQTRLSLANGPSIVVTLIREPNGASARLLFVAHHLFIDAVSWRILLEDLSRAYIGSLQGQPIAWPPKSASFGAFSRRCIELASNGDLDWHSQAWKERLSRPHVKLLRDGNQVTEEHCTAANLVGNSRELTVELSERETVNLVKGATRVHRAQVQELLLAALAEALTAFSAGDAVRVDVEGNGRDGPWNDLELSRTVGWFTSIEPITLRKPQSSGVLEAVKNELRESRRHHEFGIQVYLSDHAAELQKCLSEAPAQICFNFLGELDAADEFTGLSFASESVGPLRGPLQSRQYDFEVNAMIRKGQLQVEWTFNPGFHRDETVKRLASDFLSHLRRYLITSDAGANGTANASGVESDEPRDALDYELLEIWQHELNSRTIGIHDSIVSHDGSTESLERVLSITEQRFDVECRNLPANDELTIAKLAAALRTNASECPPSPLIPIQKCGKQAPFFFVHPAGGNIFPYYNLAHRLGDNQPVWGLEAQGLEGVLPPHTSVSELAEFYLKAIMTCSPNGPYRMGGWSFGGLVAYEMAHQLRNAGKEVELLALIDTRVVAGGKTAESQAAFAALLAMLPGTDAEQAGNFLALPPDAQLTQFTRHVETAGLAPAGTSRSTARRMLEVFEANSTAWLEYVPPTANGPVHLFLAEETSDGDIFSEDLGWATPAGDQLMITRTPGNHLTMMREPNTQELAQRISANFKY